MNTVRSLALLVVLGLVACRSGDLHFDMAVSDLSASGPTAVVCPPGQVRCNGACIDPTLDSTHCGATGDCTGESAGQACSGGLLCAAGQCATVCAPGLAECGGGCIDPQESDQYCGASGSCGHDAGSAGMVCPSSTVCYNGACVPCPAGGGRVRVQRRRQILRLAHHGPGQLRLVRAQVRRRQRLHQRRLLDRRVSAPTRGRSSRRRSIRDPACAGSVL